MDATPESALEYLEAGQRGRALDALLEAWRRERAAWLAECVTDVGIEAARGLEPISGRTRVALHEHWLDVAYARRAIDLPRLLAALRSPPWTRFRERLARLVLFPDDPRIAQALATFVEDRPVLSGIDHAGWREVLRLLARQRDVRCLGPIRNRQLQPSSGALVEEQTIRPLLNQLTIEFEGLPRSEAMPGVARDLRRVVRRLAAGAPPTQAQLSNGAREERSEAQLLQAVYFNPDDDGPRQVYGDWLLERGDERGSFISLQFQRTLTTAERKNESALLKRHRLSLLGALEPVVDPKSARFERGFLAQLTTNFRTKKQRDELIDHPAWSTVRVLNDLGPLLEHGSLTGLHTTSTPLPFELALRLEAREKPYPRLHTLWVSLGDFSHKVRSRWCDLRAFPAVTTLRVFNPGRGENLRWLEGTPLSARLKAIDLDELPLSLDRWWSLCRALPALERLEVGQRPRFHFVRRATGWTLDVSAITYPARAWEAVANLTPSPPIVLLAQRDEGYREKVRDLLKLRHLDVTLSDLPPCA